MLKAALYINMKKINILHFKEIWIIIAINKKVHVYKSISRILCENISLLFLCLNQRDFILEKQIPHDIVYFIPPSFQCHSNVWSFFSSMVSANHDEVEGFQPIVKSVYPLLFQHYQKRDENRDKTVRVHSVTFFSNS